MSSDRARQFFEETLPMKVVSDVRRLFGSSGSIAFKIGRQAWTFRFADAEPVASGFDREADLQLWLTEPAFDALLDGSLEISRAVRMGEVKARGDLRLLAAFGRFLQREDATLGWEVSY